MSNRLEWQPVAAQGLNPLGALNTSVGAFQGAAATTQALRDSERADDALIQKSYSDLIKSHLGAGKLDVLQRKEAREAKEDSFNPAVAERIFTDHFAAGGTPENFMDNPDVMGLVNEYGDTAFSHGIQTFNRFNTGVEKETIRLTGLAETKKAARLQEISLLPVPQAAKDSMTAELESEHINTLAGIQVNARDNYVNSMYNRTKYLGLEPAEATTEGRAPTPVERQTEKSNEFSDYMGQLQSGYAEESARIDQDRQNGLINDAEYSRQKAELDESFNGQLRQLGKDSRKYNITSSTGEALSFDYTELPDGGIQVGNQVLPKEVSGALRSAVDAFDVPMEAMLAFTVKESSMNPKAVSDKGVVGLMQVTEATGMDMFKKNRELFESYGITAENINDRDNPFISAMTGAAYIAHIRDDILHGDASIEQIYVAYNIGPNDPLVKQFHNKNVPIDKLPGVDVKSIGIQNNIDVYYDKKRDAWRTPAQVSALVRERMKLTPTGEDPVTAISNVAAKEPQESNNKPAANEPVVAAELKKVKATGSYPQIDLTGNPEAGLDRALSVANSVIPMKALGADGKLGVQLSATEFTDMLTVMDITVTPKRIVELYSIVREHPVLSTMPAEEVSVLMSFAPEDMWGGIDKASTLKNIDTSLQIWEQHREKIRAQMGSAANIKKYATDFSQARERLQGSISEAESSLKKLEGRKLTKAEEIGKQETARLLLGYQKELASATAMYQGRIQEDYEKILRFREELMQTYINKPSARAEEEINELERKKRRSNFAKTTGQDLERLTDGKTPLTKYLEGITTP